MRIFRHLLVIMCLLLAAVILRRSIPSEVNTPTSNDQVQGESTQKDDYLELEVGGTSVRARWFKVEDTNAVTFIANYDEFLPSADVIDSNQCKQLTSAGFYGENDEPLGLVISNGELINSYNSSALFNGVLSINDFGTPRITRNIPSGNNLNAVQTGPILWENGSQSTLNLSRDKYSRRVVGAVSGNNELYFMVFYDANSAFKGPLLSQAPGLINEINNKLNLNIADAINLDGGTASVFVDEDVALSELSPVGSFWCIK